MWRPETTREKEAREHPKALIEPIGNQSTTQVHDYATNDQALRDDGLGCLVDCGKAIRYALYVVCCCGCDTSYEDFEG
jgi:hypothetical protein